MPPTTKAALEDPAISEDPFLSVFLEQSLTAIVEPYQVQLAEWNELKDRFDPEWQAALIGEKDVPTRHRKITIVDRKPRDPASVLSAIEQLQAAGDEEPSVVIEHLQRVVPAFGRTPDTLHRRAA